MRFGFLKKHRKAKRMPVEEMEKRMEEKYGVFGSAMAERFPGGMVTFDAVNAMGLKGVNAEVKMAGNKTKSFF